ncbi:MAG: response regulator [Enterobacterales bacterium endosymbiont of Blomia tropicalis]|nr:response regulator [Mixta mediterraneensis]MDL4913799.1 response regulator [Mixta mediterraneensis]
MIYIILAIALGLFAFSSYKLWQQKRIRHIAPSQPRQH